MNVDDDYESNVWNLQEKYIDEHLDRSSTAQ